MRVIFGEAAGKKLKAPKKGIRPLTDYAKQALFNILAGQVEGVVFLDLFAGSGAVGIEALSRGAEKCFFVEINRKTAEFIRENLGNTGLTEKAQVFCLDVLAALRIFGKANNKFSIVFVGAPYDDPKLEQALEIIGQSDILEPGAVVIAEHRKQHKLAQAFGSLKVFDERNYGDTILSFYSMI